MQFLSVLVVSACNVLYSSIVSVTFALIQLARFIFHTVVCNKALHCCLSCLVGFVPATAKAA